jgi:hypothetical protein
MRRKVIQMDPHGVLATRPVSNSGNSNSRKAAAEKAV